MILDNNTNPNTKAILGRTGDSTYQIPWVDGITHALTTITQAHQEIHEEESFTAYFAITTAATDAHRSGLYIKTPNNKLKVHMIFSGSAGTAADLSILESPTIASNTGTGGGIIFNRFRDSTNTCQCRDNATTPALNRFTTLSEAQISGDGTWNVGTVLRTFPLTAGSGPKPAGGDQRGSQEYVLARDTAYVLLLTNTAASANAHLLQMDWYERIPLAP